MMTDHPLDPFTQSEHLLEISRQKKRIADLENQLSQRTGEIDDLRQNAEIYHLLLDESSDPIFAFQTFRAEDIIARYGGDEFLILLPETDEQAALQAVNRLRENASNFPNPAVSLSIGTATGGSDTPLAELIRLADDRMYQDKASRNISDLRSKPVSPA